MKTPLVACAILLTLASGARAAAFEAEIESEIRITSSYVWRGEVINDKPCFQPSITLVAPDLPVGGRTALDIWGNWDLDHDSESAQRARVDATLRSTFVGGEHMLRPALIAHIYNDDYRGRAKDTWEVCLDYTMDVPGLPGIAIYYDFVDIHGVYIAASAGHSISFVKDEVALDLKANLGWADGNYTDAKFSLPKYSASGDRTFEPDKSAFLDITLTAELPVRFNDQLTVTPGIKYMYLLDSEIRDALDSAGENPDNFGGSISMTYSF